MLNKQLESKKIDILPDVTFPIEVAEMHAVKKYSLIKSWRIFKKKTQKEMAQAMGITQGAFSQIEKNANNQTETLVRVANFQGRNQFS